MPEQHNVTAIFWAQVAANWSTWYIPPTLRGIRVIKITQNKPKHPEPGCVLVKLRVSLPMAAFVPPVFEGELQVEPGHYEQVPARVEAERP